MNKLVFVFLSLLITLTLPKPAFAQNCTTQYGGEVVCVPNDLTINKEVLNPSTQLFVENLTSSDPSYSPGWEIEFRLTIKNASGETFNPVTVKDVFPQYLTFVGGPGTYNRDNRTLTFTLDNMIAGETRTVAIIARVADKNAFTQSQSITCLNNFASVAAAGRNSEDRSQFCIQNQVLGATTLPVAGVNELPLLLPFMGIGLTGLTLLIKRK